MSWQGLQICKGSFRQDGQETTSMVLWNADWVNSPTSNGNCWAIFGAWEMPYPRTNCPDLRSAKPASLRYPNHENLCSLLISPVSWCCKRNAHHPSCRYGQGRQLVGEMQLAKILFKIICSISSLGHWCRPYKVE